MSHTKMHLEQLSKNSFKTGIKFLTFRSVWQNIFTLSALMFTSNLSVVSTGFWVFSKNTDKILNNIHQNLRYFVKSEQVKFGY